MLSDILTESDFIKCTPNSNLGRNFTQFWGVRGLPCETFLSVAFYFSGISSPVVLCPVDCSAEVHSTTIFALRSSKIFEEGADSAPYPLGFVPDCITFGKRLCQEKRNCQITAYFLCEKSDNR